MRILIVSQWFDPEPFYKGLPFARQLAEYGHEVEVLTGYPNYPGGRVYPGYKIRPWMREVQDGVRITRVALYPSHDRSALRRIGNYLSFCGSAVMLGSALTNPADVIYAYHPPGTVGLAAIWLKYLKTAALVYDVQDMWPDSLRATGMFNNTLALRAMHCVMKTVYKRADRIIVLSQGFRDMLLDRGVPERKVRVVWNWSPDECAAATWEDAPGESVRDDGRFTVVYAGNMGPAQALGAVLEAARRLQDLDSRVEFVLVGSGIERARLQVRAQELGLRNVRFCAPVPVAEIGALLQSADALLVHLRDDPLFSVTIPSKTQSYLMAGRPIVMAVRGEAAELVGRAGAGVTCEPENPVAIAEAVLHLARMTPHERQLMGKAGRGFYWSNLSFEHGVRQIEAIMREAAEERGR